MRIGQVMGVAVMVAAAAGGAQASDPAKPERGNGIYYHRAGASVADLDADSKRCNEAAARTVATHRAAGGGLMGALVFGFTDGMRKGSERRRNFETCMVVAGWQEVMLTATEADALKAAVATDRAAALAPLVGGDPIRVGTPGRRWANDFAEPRAEGGDDRAAAS